MDDLVERAIGAKDEKERDSLCQQLVSEIRRQWEARRNQSADEFDDRAGDRGIG